MRPRLALAALCVAGFTSLTEPARAAPAECFAAADEAQNLRDEGRYVAARERLAVCSAAVCPEVVQRDCSRWIDELMQLWPSILVHARDLVGRDLVDVKVSVDGKPVADRLDGAPLQVEPGEHRLVCEVAGAPAVEQPVVLRAGEKNRVVEVQLATGAPVAVVPPGPLVPPPPTPPIEPAPSPPAGLTLRWVFGGAAVAAFGVASGFGAVALSRYNTMEASGCVGPRNCHPSDVSFTQNNFLVSDVALGLGLASAAAAAYFFVRARFPAAAPAGTRIVPAIGVGPGSASLAAVGVF